jgi:hypothetical protein
VIGTGTDQTPVARARALARAGHLDEASAIVKQLLREEFALEARDLRINTDIYSLNSLNGTFEAGAEALFFKFHQEENEGAMSGEYYRAKLLADAGLPIDLPIYASTSPGRQILVYRRRSEPRFADVARSLDLSPDAPTMAAALAAELALNESLIDVYRRTWHPIAPGQSEAEPIHRLFHERLVTTGSPGGLGGRFASFYQDQVFRLPCGDIPWRQLKDLTFVFNGNRYSRTLAELFDESHIRLHPRKLADGGGVTAHGDAHNANVWCAGHGSNPHLIMFDPAFAGEHVPALLAEVKATFHNVFAHPLWLYEPAEATKQFSIAARVKRDCLIVETDWRPGHLRAGILELKRDLLWRPLLQLLRDRGSLPPDWRHVLRLALFLCPTLVMSLRTGTPGGSHTPASSALGLAVAVSMGGEPDRPDATSAFLDAIDPGK